MSRAYLRWRCPACGNLHTRKIEPHPDDRHILTVKTGIRLIDRPGDQVYVLPTPIDLTCDAGDALIPDEERLP